MYDTVLLLEARKSRRGLDAAAGAEQNRWQEAS